MPLPRFQPQTLAIQRPLFMLPMLGHLSPPCLLLTGTAPKRPVTSPCLGSCLAALSSPGELSDVGLEGEGGVFR